MNENDIPNEGQFPLRFEGWDLEKDHFNLIFKLAKDRGLDPYEYLCSLMEWIRQKGYGPRD